MSLPFTTDTSVQLSYTSFPFTTPKLDNYATSNHVSNVSLNNSNYTRIASNILKANIDTKQDKLTTETTLLGVGGSITGINYNTIINKPTNFQADWNSTVINKPTYFSIDPAIYYNQIQVNTSIQNTSNYASNISNVIITNFYNKTQTDTIITNLYSIDMIIYTPEREYPPKAFNSCNISFTTTTTTGELLNINPIYYNKETITLNTDGINYGSGEYKIYASSGYQTRYKINLFDKINNNIAGWYFNYTGGYYTGSSYIKNDYLGDWLIFELPKPIFLTRFQFSNNQVSRAPALWRCYGSNDGINFTEINAASNDVSLTTSDYSTGTYQKILSPIITTSYKYIGFTINKLVGNDITLIFGELRLFGYERIQSYYYSKIESDNISNVIITNTSNYASNISNVLLNTFNISNLNNSNYSSNISNVLLTTFNISNLNNSNYASNISNVLLTNISLNNSNYASDISNVLLTTFNISNFNTSNYASNISNVLLTNLTNNYYNKTSTDTLLNTKQATLTFTSPLVNTTNTITLNESVITTLTNFYNKTATDTLLNAKQATLTFTSPLVNTTNTITLNESVITTLTNFYNKTATDTLLNAKQATLTAATTLYGTGGNITGINYNNITLNKPTNFQSDWNTTIINKPTIYTQTETNQLLNAKQATLTFTSPLVNTTNTITLNESAITTLTNFYNKTDSDGRYLKLTGGTMTGNLTLTNSLLSFGSTVGYKIISIYDGGNTNNFQFVGLGANSGLCFNNFATSDAFQFRVGTSTTTAVELMRINGNGNVGIGTNNPSTYKLNVNGDTKISGNILGTDGIELQSSTVALYVSNSATKSLFAGSVGVGLLLPDAKLHIASGTTSTGNIYQKYYSVFLNDQTLQYQTLTTVCSIFDSAIWVKDRISTSSDIRIKKNIKDINDDMALQKILQIEPKTYEYIDKVEKGDGVVYGFIAQQIKDVIPEAVKIENGIIPNIFKICNYNNDIISIPEEDIKKLNVNDEIEIIIKNDNNKKLCKILEINDDNTIKINESLNTIEETTETLNECFVYGSKVDNFHTLDKNYIFALNVCATQELYKIIQQLKERILVLETRLI
jgi:hypothetical protein